MLHQIAFSCGATDPELEGPDELRYKMMQERALASEDQNYTAGLASEMDEFVDGILPQIHNQIDKSVPASPYSKHHAHHKLIKDVKERIEHRK